ncbi:MAG: HEAT repeat domain-containing protein [Deltaproteobacteria bacterium]|nr:HEAT repeat domain-containing protein [Deltaproteobacteria bacterium]
MKRRSFKFAPALAASAILCLFANSASAVLPRPPNCRAAADSCDRIPWIEQVMWSRDKEAIPFLRTMAAGDAHERVRQRSLGALAILGDSEAHKVFLGRLSSDPSPAVRRAAAEGIGLLKFPGPQPALTEHLQNDSNPLVRAECARAMGRMGKLAYVPYLTAALFRDPSPEVRALSAEALARLRTPDATIPLIESVKDEDPLVRLYAIRGLVESDPSAAMSLFRQVWDTTKDPELRVEAFRGLLLSGESVKWSDAGLGDQDERVRFLALQEWVTRLSRRKGGPFMLDHESLRRLESCLSDPVRGIRELAKSFLEKMGYRVKPSGFYYMLER